MSETSEGVGEALTDEELADSLEEAAGWLEEDHPQAYHFRAAARRLRHLRERLEGCEEALEESMRDHSDARRRADRMEEALDIFASLDRLIEEDMDLTEARDPMDNVRVEYRGETYWLKKHHLETARSALDSGEGAGEGCTCPQVMLGDGSWWGSGPNPGCPVHGEDDESCTCGPPRVSTSGSLGGTLPDVEGRRDPDCPVHGYDADATGSDSAHADEPEGDEMADFDETADYDPGDRYGQISAESLDEYRDVLDRMDEIRGLAVHAGGAWFRDKAEQAEDEGYDSAAHALRQAALVADERTHLRRLIADDSPTDKPVSGEGEPSVSDLIGRRRLCRALDIDPDQDPEAIWHQIEHDVAVLMDATHADVRSDDDLDHHTEEPEMLSDEDVEHIEEWAENATTDQVAAAMREKLRLERRLSTRPDPHGGERGE